MPVKVGRRKNGGVAEMDQAVFARLCEERQWGRPAVFLAEYAKAAACLGEPGQVTARQFHRWRQLDPPCPGPSRQRVLEKMFGKSLGQLGFTLPPGRGRVESALPAPPVVSATGGRLSGEAGAVDAAAGTDGLSGTLGAGLRFVVLGPVRIWRGRQALPIRTPQEQAVLCVLLLRRGSTATASELVDAVWETPPPQAIAALRTYAWRLRRALGPGVLLTDAGGYALRARPEALDLEVCQGYEARAKDARAEGEPHKARKLLHMADTLWDGQPLAGVPGPYAHAQRGRLEEWRLALLEKGLELDLELGRHAEAVSELTALITQHPVRERLRALLMLALYRGGRQAEALGVYTDTRRLLAEELGVEPNPELARLHQRILRADPALTGPQELPADGEPAHTPPPRPAQLPAGAADFTGRATAVRILRERLLNPHGTVMALSAVRGLGGAGKTALAVHVAQAVRKHFPDGQLFVDLLGQGSRPADPAAVLGMFLRALGTPPADLPEGIHERAALYRSTLADRRVLVLLDNAHDTAQVRPLLPGTPGCATLITSRSTMADLDGVHMIDLSVMEPGDALALFTRIVGDQRASAEPQACRQAVAACGYLPLAIRVAASRLATRPGWTINTLTDRLADVHRRLQELRAGDLAVQTSFEFGYAQLNATQARAFRLLGLCDGPDISLSAAVAALGTPARETERILESLVDTCLLESVVPGRYRYHDLLRLYACSCAVRDERPETRAAAFSRILDFYLSSAARVYAMERPGDRLIEHLARIEHLGQPFPDAGTALAWLLTEADCLLSCAYQAAKSSEKDVVCRAADLLLVTRELVDSGASSLHYVAAEQPPDAEASRTGLAAGDLTAACYASNMRGVIAIYRRRYEEAEAHFREALHGFRTGNNLSGIATALCNLSRVHAATGRTDSAIELAMQGIDLWKSLGAHRTSLTAGSL
ncbi:AfsR/SARP family transcriptional regulator [Streptomyces endocoffeicus]|uniref:AfsR/SARP family transcriptional regulator n=1 Tax=Streptomyces endocoffeicus TaxID=2898945 RepID=UPI0027DCBC6A|nr:BTAD domain-containing putative transcriptional regulator [Streptomyces endocoffeicus]